MNVIFTVIFFISLIVMTIIAPDKLLSSLLGGAEKSAATALTLFCIYAVWMGLSRLAEKSGFSRGAARALKPLTKKMFKTENDAALENLAMNSLPFLQPARHWRRGYPLRSKGYWRAGKG